MYFAYLILDFFVITIKAINASGNNITKFVDKLLPQPPLVVSFLLVVEDVMSEDSSWLVFELISSLLEGWLEDTSWLELESCSAGITKSIISS